MQNAVPYADFFITDAKSGDNNKSRRAMLNAAVYSLENCVTKKQREVLKKHLFAGLSVTELARLYGCNKSVVSRHISRGTKRLKQGAQKRLLQNHLS